MFLIKSNTERRSDKGVEMLDIQVFEDHGVVVISMAGPIDSSTLAEFRKVLDPVTKKKRTHIVLDFSALTYMNSRALGLLSSYRRRIYAGGGRLAVCGVSKKIGRSLDLLGLGKVLKMYESREDAVAALK